jgi:hypothetical protein
MDVSYCCFAAEVVLLSLRILVEDQPMMNKAP